MQHGKFSRHHLCSELVSLQGASQNRAEPGIDGNLEEIGEWSALILAQEAVPRGTKVRVKGKTQELKGSVKSCTFDGVLGFFVEIELDLESRWSEQWFAPEHLYTLCPSLRCFTEKTNQVPEELFPAIVAPV